jgi:hypothetical protein
MKATAAPRFSPRVEHLEDRTLPSSYTTTPVIPTLDAATAARLSQVVQHGLQAGNRPNVFARAGDSITFASQFLVPLANPSPGVDSAVDGSLTETLNFFRSGTIGSQNSFARTSTAAHGGYSTTDLLALLPGELAATRPAFVLIEVGTNDIALGYSVDVFRQNLTVLAQTALNMGVVPVLSTIPDILLSPQLQQRQPSFNQAIEDVGEALQVPVWNYWRALQRLPGVGIGGDLVHPSVSPAGGGDFTPAGLQYGYNVRNLTALQTLDKLKRVLFQGAPPDAPDLALGWAPLTHAIPVGRGDGPGFQVQVIDAQTRQTLFSFDPFPGFAGGVHTTTGDVNGDHVPDLIAVPGPGGPPHVKAFDGKTGALLESFYAFDPNLLSGLSVAAADVNGDGRAEIVVCPEAGGPSHVKVFAPGGQLYSSFYAFAPSFLGGATVAAADVNRDGFAEVMVAAGRGGHGHLLTFSGPGLTLVSSFLPFGPAYAGDVSLAAGDFNGDGFAELAVGAGAGAPPVVSVFNPLTASLLTSFYVYAPGFLGGVGLATVDRGRGHAELVTASGAAAASDVRIYAPLTATLLDAFVLYELGARRGASLGS